MNYNNFIFVVILATCAGLFGSSANAANGSQDQTYFGFQYAQVEEDELDLEPTAAVFRLGSMTDQGYGYELRLGTGLSSDDLSETLPFFGDVELELEIDHLIGVYLLAEGNLGTGSIYGIIGYSMIDYTLKAESSVFGSDSESDDESDLSFGFGANFGRSDSVRFNIEYMQYLDKDDIDASAISLGVLF